MTATLLFCQNPRRRWRRRAFVAALAATVLATSPSRLGAQADLGRVLPADRALHVVAFGDFGSGRPEQRETAEAIARRHAAQPFDLGLTMGDNFYRCGVKNVTDPKWKTRWEDLYTPLGIPFYATLGNHDYGHPDIICLFTPGSPSAQVEYTKHSASWRMPSRYYTYVAGAVRFIAIDTEGWTDRQLTWIGEVLRKSAGEPGVRWRIVYGHHPMFTSGVHINQRRIGALRRHLFPVLKAGGVDLFIAGHDHDMERLHMDGVDFLIAGGGGAKIRSIRKATTPSLFSVVSNGFLELRITNDELTAQFLNPRLEPLDGNPLKRVK